jgi:hypothetical protein
VDLAHSTVQKPEVQAAGAGHLHSQAQARYHLAILRRRRITRQLRQALAAHTLPLRRLDTPRRARSIRLRRLRTLPHRLRTARLLRRRTLLHRQAIRRRPHRTRLHRRATVRPRRLIVVLHRRTIVQHRPRTALRRQCTVRQARNLVGATTGALLHRLRRPRTARRVRSTLLRALRVTRPTRQRLPSTLLHLRARRHTRLHPRSGRLQAPRTLLRKPTVVIVVPSLLELSSS